jgi:D-amino-acid dehydrogenase
VTVTAAGGAARAAPSDAHVVVVGAGVIGSCIAYRLRTRGLRVTLVDRDEPGRGCSFGNSGAISPGSVAPLAMPGVLAALPGMLLDAESPLYLPAAYLPRALPWLLRFAASARPARVARAADALAALHADAVALHTALAREIGVPELVVRRGHLHLYPDAAAAAQDAAAWRMRAAHGYRFTALDRDGILALEPAIGPRYTHGRFLADHATIVDPFRYVQAIVAAALARGVTLRRADVTAVRPSAGGWSVQAGDAALPCTHVVVAAGAWSKRLLAPLRIRLALESQRGYHVQYRGPAPVTRTVVLADRKIFVTPMADGLRVGGTVEIGGLDAPPDARRAALLARIAAETFPSLDPAGATTWMGHRPCMPDSLPVIGPVAGHPGLLVAVGHGHLGMTDAVRTAERIAGCFA